MSTSVKRRTSVKWWTAVAVAVLATACASSELEVPTRHPGHPNARAGQMHRTTALAQPRAPVESPEAIEHSHSEHGRTEPGQHAEHGEHGQHGEHGDYVCPMHPEVVNKGPGKCSVCGMKLEPRKGEK